MSLVRCIQDLLAMLHCQSRVKGAKLYLPILSHFLAANIDHILIVRSWSAKLFESSFALMKADCKDHAKKYLPHVITACSKIFVYTVTKDTGKSPAGIYFLNLTMKMPEQIVKYFQLLFFKLHEIGISIVFHCKD